MNGFAAWLRHPLVLPGLGMLLGISGILTIASSAFLREEPLYHAGRQLLFLLAGLLIYLSIARIPFRKIMELLPCIAGAGFLLLAGLPLAGMTVNGMRGWYDLGVVQFQPSEVIRGIILLWLASLAGENGYQDAREAAFFWLWSFAALGLILMQPDFGTGSVYAATVLLLFYLGNGSLRWLAGIFSGGVLALGVLILKRPYVLRRFAAFWDPGADPEGAGWHIRQFFLTVAHGGWFGAKMGNSWWSGAYLPLAHNDSAYAVIAETLGLLGGAVLSAGLALLCLVLGLRALAPERTLLERLYLGGAALMIAVQSLVHIGVNVGMLPPTGLTLPFFSYGGSAMIGIWLMLGIAGAMEQEKNDER